MEFSELGSYCQFDLFGIEVSFYQLCHECDMLSDAQRIERIAELIADGKGERILASHDIHTRHRLVSISKCCLQIQVYVTVSLTETNG